MRLCLRVHPCECVRVRGCALLFHGCVPFALSMMVLMCSSDNVELGLMRFKLSSSELWKILLIRAPPTKSVRDVASGAEPSIHCLTVLAYLREKCGRGSRMERCARNRQLSIRLAPSKFARAAAPLLVSHESA